MKLIMLPVTMMQENVYFYYDENTLEGVIIDPGGEANRLCDFITDNQLKIKAILLTHGHFDHIGAVAKIKEITGAPIAAHADENEMLQTPERNMSGVARRSMVIAADILFNDGDVFEFGGHKLEVIHTPGHTVGGVSYYAEESAAVFSGDTLFFDSVGRSDFPGGSDADLHASIRDRLYTLPDDTAVYPGHGQATSIRREKESNPFVRP